MEGVGDQSFRKAIASIGGFDEAVRDFLRVSAQPHLKSLASQYQHDEIAPVPLAAQLMGSDVTFMAEMARELELKGAPRIDLNCGCPSNTVTGKGAGSSLLKNPQWLYEVARCMVKAVSIPVTAKLRSGFEDTSLFKENLLAAQESGISYLTLHPRTKLEGYGPPANWELIAEAKTLLSIPVVGNGDILTVSDALNMVKQTSCDAVMIGRGSIINPFIFQEMKAHFAGRVYQPKWSALVRYFEQFFQATPAHIPEKTKINKLKQLLGFFFKSNEFLLTKRQEILRFQCDHYSALLELAYSYIKKSWQKQT